MITTVVLLTVLGALLAIILYVVASKFKVEEDPRIDEIEKVMPGANCGGCGFAGCRAFAQSCVEKGNVDENFCPVGCYIHILIINLVQHMIILCCI